jgi:FkbM family methyltransferase
MRDQLFELLLPHLGRPVTAVDVGARWGVVDRFAGLGDNVHAFGFEPDPVECKRLNDEAAATVSYEQLALSNKPGPATLYLTVDPACASLFPPTARLATALPGLGCIAPAGTMPVEVDTLDRWQSARGVDTVDALKLDAQGADFLILQGATDMLRGVKLVEVEVCFNSFYDGQPLFPEVDVFMRQHGFVLWRFSSETHYSVPSVPGPTVKIADTQWFDSKSVEVDGGAGQLYWCNAYYTRVEFTAAATELPNWSDAVYSACAAIGYGLFDLAVLSLHNAAKTPQEVSIVNAVRELCQRG